MSNVTTIKSPPKAQPAKTIDILNMVMRAKQIVRAVRVAGDHEGTCDYPYALEEVEDILEEASDALSSMKDPKDTERQP